MNKKLLSTFIVILAAVLLSFLSGLPLNAQNPFELDEKNNPILTNEAAKQIFISSEFEIINEESILSKIFAESEHLKLSDLKGKIVVVDFWQTWCAP